MIAAAIGRFTVTRIEEMLTPGFDPAFLFPDYDASVLTAHPLLASAAFFDAPTGRLMSSMQSWLVRGDGHVILVDTGCGNGKTRSAPAFRRFHDLNLPFLERLAAAGVQPGDVTHVVNTHLHVDHVGWNTQLRDGVWTPTFPNARYVWGGRAGHAGPARAGAYCRPAGSLAGVGRALGRVLGRRPAPAHAGLSPGLEQPLLRAPGGGADHPRSPAG